MTTKYMDGVQQVEGHTDNAPRLLTSYSYSEFVTPSVTRYKNTPNCLSRNAKSRTFIFVNSLNVTTNGNAQLMPYESTIALSNIGGAVTTLASVPSTGQLIETSERNPILFAHSDSIQIGIPIGTTLPTSGKIDIYVIEQF